MNSEYISTFELGMLRSVNEILIFENEALRDVLKEIYPVLENWIPYSAKRDWQVVVKIKTLIKG